MGPFQCAKFLEWIQSHEDEPFLSPVLYLDVFWYRLNSMGAQKNALKKVLATLFPYIFHVKIK